MNPSEPGLRRETNSSGSQNELNDIKGVGEMTPTNSIHFFGVKERGAQVLFFLAGRQFSPPEAEITFGPFSDNFRLAILTSPLPNVTGVLKAAELIEEQLRQVGTKRTTIIGEGLGTPLAQALAALYPDVVRRLVMIDPSARVSPGLLLRAIDRVEQFLPFGLPLRPLTEDFDSRPLLHRIRCPTLIVRSGSASKYARDQSLMIASKIPNARIEESVESNILSGPTLELKFVNRLISFLQVPAKRPQKNIGGGMSE